MKLNKTIRKIIMLAAWLIVGSGLLVLLIAANGKEQKHVCENLVVSIRGNNDAFYTDKSKIISQLKKESGGGLIKEPIADIDLLHLEKELEENAWVRDAELYFDRNDVLHVTINEREPIARIFTKTGASFYIDSAGMRMPLLEGVSVRLPVVTSFTNAKRLYKSDSALLNEVKTLVSFVIKDDFWNAQVAQIDIVDDRTFEIIPTVGNHIIKIGNSENLERKFNQLRIFYEQVLSKAGIDKYSVLDVQFDGQVVATQKGTSTYIDSIQLQKNIKELLEKSQLEEAEENMAKAEPIQKIIAKPEPVKKVAVKPTVKNNPTSVKTKPKAVAKPVVKKVEVKKKETRKPKAVMKKAN